MKIDRQVHAPHQTPNFNSGGWSLKTMQNGHSSLAHSAPQHFYHGIMQRGLWASTLTTAAQFQSLLHQFQSPTFSTPELKTKRARMKVIKRTPSLQDCGAQAQKDISVECSTADDVVQKLLCSYTSTTRKRHDDRQRWN